MESPGQPGLGLIKRHHGHIWHPVTRCSTWCTRSRRCYQKIGATGAFPRVVSLAYGAASRKRCVRHDHRHAILAALDDAGVAGGDGLRAVTGLAHRGPAMTQPCIVIIDDNPADIELVGIAFGMREITVDMRTAGDGEQGIALLARLEGEHLIPGLVLLDLNMPRVSGFEVLAFIRGRTALAAMPVIVFSSSTAPRDRERSIELGATDFMTKPNDLAALLVLVDRLGAYVTRPAP